MTDLATAARKLSAALHKMDPPATSGMSVDPLGQEARAALNEVDEALSDYFTDGGGAG